MDRSGSQKALLVISIIDIVLGVFTLIAGVMAIMGGGMIGVATSEIAASGEAGAAEVAAVGGLASIGGLLMIFTGVISALEGVLGVRAANDNQKIMPVWILAIIGLIAAVISLIMAIVQKGDILSSVGGLIGSGLMFWIANNIKTQAGI